jgi:hypothetical protein
MSMPASGALRLSQVNTELGRSATAPIGMSDPGAQFLRGSSSTRVQMGQFRAKTRFVMVAGVSPSNGVTTGWGNGPDYWATEFGSMTPESDTRYNIMGLNAPNGPNSLHLTLYGFRLPQNHFTVLVINGVSYFSNNVNVYAFGDNFNGWTWYVNPNIVNGGVYSCYLY